MLQLQATQQECDVSALQKACTSLLSSNDPALVGLVPPAMQAAAAATQTSDSIQNKINECLTALAALSSQIERHAETSAAVAVELRRQPACQELAIERELVAQMQMEMSQRIGHTARLRGHCTLPPFSQAFEAFKAEAATKLHMINQQTGGAQWPQLPQPPQQAQQQQLVVPQGRGAGTTSPELLHDQVQVLTRGLHAVAAQVDQLARKERPHQLQQGGDKLLILPQLRLQGPVPESRSPAAELRGGPELIAPRKAPRIQEVSPGGTAQPGLIQTVAKHRQGSILKKQRKEEEIRRENAAAETREAVLPQEDPIGTESRALR